MDPRSKTWNSGTITLNRFEENGFQIVRGMAGLDECDLLVSELTPLFVQQQAANRGKIGGIRNLLRNSHGVAKFGRSARVISLIERLVNVSVFPVRAIFFDKNPHANWLVPWHQDLVIAVAQRIETAGFSGWSIKNGVPHVHPPQEILEGMITLRLHLDDCNSENGALHVIPGSHHRGKINVTDISQCVPGDKSVVCELFKGDALLMRPLLLHASWPALIPTHRRVLHVEYATRDLPNGLKWFDA